MFHQQKYICAQAYQVIEMGYIGLFYANKQWGKSSSSGRATTTVTLPLTMPVAIDNVVISQAAASDTWSTWSSIVSTSQIKLTNNYGPGSWWFVTGRQQWGLNYTSKTITFPISFTTVPTAYSATVFSQDGTDVPP